MAEGNRKMAYFSTVCLDLVAFDRSMPCQPQIAEGTMEFWIERSLQAVSRAVVGANRGSLATFVAAHPRLAFFFVGRIPRGEGDGRAGFDSPSFLGGRRRMSPTDQKNWRVGAGPNIASHPDGIRAHEEKDISPPA